MGLQVLHEHRGCELTAQVANHGQWSTETWFAYALLTRSLRGAYANLRHQTCKKKHDSKYHEILQASIWSKPKHNKLREILEKVAVTTFWLSNSYHHHRKNSSDTVVQSGIILLTPKLTHCILQKSLTPPYETQCFACATQSYDTTLTKAYSGGL